MPWLASTTEVEDHAGVRPQVHCSTDELCRCRIDPPWQSTLGARPLGRHDDITTAEALADGERGITARGAVCSNRSC